MSDYGTDERHKHGVVKAELTGRGHAVRMRAHDSCELDRLAYGSIITHDEWSAGDTFARKLHAARMMGMATSRPERVQGGGHISDRQAAALVDVEEAHRWMDGSCGERARKLTTHVCLSEVRVGTQEEIYLLRAGLKALVDLYDGRRTSFVGAMSRL